MQKKASAKGGMKNRKTRRKLLDLPAKTVKGGDAGSIKGGIPRIGQEAVSTTQPEPNYTTAGGCKIYVP